MMPFMAGETIAFDVRLMTTRTVRFSAILSLMAAQAYLLRSFCQHERIIAGMNGMTLAALSPPIRRMSRICSLLDDMAVETQFVGLLIDGKIFSGLPVTTFAVSPAYRLMNDILKHCRTFRDMRGVAQQAATLDRTTPVSIFEILVQIVAGTAEFISRPDKESLVFRAMADMAGSAAIHHRQVDIFSRELLLIVTAKAEFRLGRGQQRGIFSAVHLMTGGTATFRHRFMDRLFLQGFRFFLMAGQALARLLAAQVHPADHAVVEVTGLAVPSQDRLMDDFFCLQAGGHIRVALHTPFLPLPIRLSGSTGDQDKNSKPQHSKQSHFLTRHQDSQFLF